MIYSRYAYSASLAQGRRVLELGCGSGQGFGLIGAQAARLVGVDIDLPLLRRGRRHFQDRFPFVQATAEALPFADASFDLVLFFEATYYVPQMELAFDEVRRVLAPDGIVVFVNANPERPDFIRSPHSVHYHTGDEFREALVRRGFEVTVEGAYRVDTQQRSSTVIKAVRRVLETFGLVPTTLKGRARLKRIMYGTLIELPPEIPPGFGTPVTREQVGGGAVTDFKVIYVTAQAQS